MWYSKMLIESNVNFGNKLATYLSSCTNKKHFAFSNVRFVLGMLPIFQYSLVQFMLSLMTGKWREMWAREMRNNMQQKSKAGHQLGLLWFSNVSRLEEKRHIRRKVTTNLWTKWMCKPTANGFPISLSCNIQGHLHKNIKMRLEGTMIH